MQREASHRSRGRYLRGATTRSSLLWVGELREAVRESCCSLRYRPEGWYIGPMKCRHITPIRPPRVKSAQIPRAALRSSVACEKRSGPRDSDFISNCGCGAVGYSAPNTYRGSAGVETPVQEKGDFSRALETHLCPRTVRFKRGGLRWRV